MANFRFGKSKQCATTLTQEAIQPVGEKGFEPGQKNPPCVAELGKKTNGQLPDLPSFGGETRSHHAGTTKKKQGRGGS